MPFENYLEEVVRPCIDCGRIVPMARIVKRCEICDKIEDDKRRPDEQRRDRDELHLRWKRQGIPTRFWPFELEAKYCEAMKRSAIIYGEVGTGKSCLGAQIMKNTGGIFQSTIAMLDDIQENVSKIWHFKDMVSLCLDDFVKINPTPHRIEKLFEIINSRYENNRHTIMTTDTRPSEIRDKLGGIAGEAIVSRIGEWCIKVHMEIKFR